MPGVAASACIIQHSECVRPIKSDRSIMQAASRRRSCPNERLLRSDFDVYKYPRASPTTRWSSCHRCSIHKVHLSIQPQWRLCLTVFHIVLNADRLRTFPTQVQTTTHLTCYDEDKCEHSPCLLKIRFFSPSTVSVRGTRRWSTCPEIDSTLSRISSLSVGAGVAPEPPDIFARFAGRRTAKTG